MELLVPNSVVFELQIISPRPPHPDRKTAGFPKEARLFAGNDLELNHSLLAEYVEERSRPPQRYVDFISGENRQIEGRILGGFDAIHSVLGSVGAG